MWATDMCLKTSSLTYTLLNLSANIFGNWIFGYQLTPLVRKIRVWMMPQCPPPVLLLCWSSFQGCRFFKMIGGAEPRKWGYLLTNNVYIYIYIYISLVSAEFRNFIKCKELCKFCNLAKIILALLLEAWCNDDTHDCKCQACVLIIIAWPDIRITFRANSLWAEKEANDTK